MFTILEILSLIQKLGSTANKMVEEGRAQTTAEEDANLARAMKSADLAHKAEQEQ